MKKLALIFLLTSCANQTLVDLPIFNKNYWQAAKVQTPVAPEVKHKWWLDFEDETLSQLIEKARTQSPDVKIALARIESARAAEEGTIASQYPVFSVGGNAGRDKLSQTITSRPTNRKYTNNFSAGFDAAWEVNPSNLEPALRAADANAKIQEQSYNNVLVTLAGDIARNYFEIRKLQQQIKVANSNVDAQKEVVSLTQSLVDAGKVSHTDSAAAQTLLSKTIAEINPMQQQLDETIYKLEVLVGVQAGDLKQSLAAPDNINLEDKPYALVAPANMLANRPDVLAAEQKVKYNAALKDVAFSAYYPKVSLSTFLGLETGNFSKILNGKSTAESIAGGLTAPIFDFGRIKADVKEKSAEVDVALAEYQKTVLAAFSEVESAVNAISQERQHYEDLKKALESSQLSFKLANERYKRGLSSFINVLEAQKNVNSNQQLLAVSKADILINQVRLYKALGGGWKG